MGIRGPRRVTPDSFAYLSHVPPYLRTHYPGGPTPRRRRRFVSTLTYQLRDLARPNVKGFIESLNNTRLNTGKGGLNIRHWDEGSWSLILALTSVSKFSPLIQFYSVIPPEIRHTDHRKIFSSPNPVSVCVSTDTLL